jgi:hypothetical protein
MHRPPRVKERQRRTDVARDGARLSPVGWDELLQVAPVEELHRVVGTLVIQSIVVDFDDARVPELGERVKLALEQLDGASLLSAVVEVPESLQRDAVTRDVVEGLVHDGHAPLPEFPEEGVSRAHHRAIRCLDVGEARSLVVDE